MIAEHREPKLLPRDAKPVWDRQGDAVRRDKAETGSKRLRDAILKLQGIAPPRRQRPHIRHLCPSCLAPVSGASRLLIAGIQQTVAAYYGLPAEAMISKDMRRIVSRPRQVAMYLANQLTSHSIAEIGRRFGNRDHTTILHALKAVKERTESDEEEAYDVSLLRERLAA